MCSEKIILCKREITYVDIVENIPILDSKKKTFNYKGSPSNPSCVQLYVEGSFSTGGPGDYLYWLSLDIGDW